MRFAVIGCGVIAERGHLPALKYLKNAEIIALVDIRLSRARRLAKKYGIANYYSTPDKTFADDKIDSVVITAPTPLHAELAIAAANAGKNIVVEKPLASSLSEGRAIERAVRENDVRLTVIQNYRYNPSILKAKEAIQKCSIGSITSFYVLAHTPLPNRWTRSNWLYYEPGVLLDFAPHAVDAILWLLKKHPKKVYAVGGDLTRNSGFINHAHILLQFDDNVGVIDLSWMSGTQIFNLSFIGTGGMLLIDPFYLTFFEKHGITTPIEDFMFFINRMNVFRHILTGKIFNFPYEVYKNIYRDYIQAIEKKKRMPVEISEALDVLKILEGTFTSIKKGEVIDLQSNSLY